MRDLKVCSTVVFLIFFGVLFQLTNNCLAGGENEPVWAGCAESNQVALTFDDGPDPKITPEILAILQQYDAKATFFCVGINVLKYPELARRIVDEGHEMGNHTFSHPNLAKGVLSFKDVAIQIGNGQRAIFFATRRMPKVFRPPYSATSDAINEVANILGHKVVIWSCSPTDYEDPTSEEIVERVLSKIKGGSIVVLHDGHENMPFGHVNTVRALPAILKGFRERHLAAVTVSELLKYPR